MASSTQRIGKFLFAAMDQATPVLVDVSEYVTNIMLNSETTDVTIPANLKTGRVMHENGPVEESIELTHYGPADPTIDSVWAIANDAFRNYNGEVAFEMAFDAGAYSATNPKYKGTGVVQSVSTGGQVGQLRSYTMTIQVNSLTISNS